MTSLDFKGQVSFEALFILLIVLSSGIFITNLYLQTHDVTVAAIIARTDILQQLNSFDELIVLREVTVESVNNGGVFEAEILITTNPSKIQKSDFDQEKLNETSAKIIKLTKFSAITFKIN